MTEFKNIRDIRIEQDNPRRYICNLDLKLKDEEFQTVQYCADGVDPYGICPQVFATIEAMADKSCFISEVNYKKSIQQDMYNRHDERMLAERQRRFTVETDHLKFKYDETQLETDRQIWIDAKNVIRNELKYINEMTEAEISLMYPLLGSN